MVVGRREILEVAPVTLVVALGQGTMVVPVYWSQMEIELVRKSFELRWGEGHMD